MKDCCAIIIDNDNSNLRRTIERYAGFVNETVVLTNADAAGFSSTIKFISICGCESFAALVKLGIERISGKYLVVAVHDTAQPFEFSLEHVLDLAKFSAAIVGTKAVDTIKVVNNSVISRTIDRNLVWNLSSPFALNLNTLEQLCDSIILKNIDCHNTASFALQCFKLGLEIKVVERTEKI